jgi:hypothetical protein
MTQYSAEGTFPSPPPSPSGPPGLSIASVIVSATGICLPGAGLIGIALGAIGFVQSRSRRAGTGVSIAGIVLGIVTSLIWGALVAFILFPAYFGGLTTAKTFVSGAYATMIASALNGHAAANNREYPPPGTNLESLLSAEIPGNVWIAPLGQDRSTTPSFLLVYESTDPPYQPRWIILNPDIPDIKLVPMVDVSNESLDMVEPGEAVRLIGDSMLYTTDGRLWRLTGPVP